MIRVLRDVRLVPVVLVAAGVLFILKFTGLVTDGGYTLGAGHLSKSDRVVREAAELAASRSPRQGVAPQTNEAAHDKVLLALKQSWAQETFKYPDVTGSVGASKPSEKKETESGKGEADKKDAERKEAAKSVEPKPSPGGVVIPLEPKSVSPAERAILERLTERRQELDARERELGMRETLLQAQEKRLDAKVNELKDVEAKITAATKKKQETELAKLKGLVTMYENMKAKDAAKIFDRLDIRLATEVANQIAPRRMSDILAQMSPESAERLTVELANRNASDRAPSGAELPKIEGKMGGT